MSYSDIKVLDSKLAASSKGEPIAESYRAVLAIWDQPIEAGRVVIRIERQNNHGLYDGVGAWHLSTLLHGDSVGDALSIDYGQQWQIDSGMRAAVFQAAKFLADNYQVAA